MKIISYNVNGIRSAMSKGLIEWLKATNADVVALQEIKAEQNQIDVAALEDLGYQHFWYSAEKKGYSGTAILSKKTPKNVEFGSGMHAYDREGRILRADFDDFSLMSVYMPSGSSGDERQNFKMQFLGDFQSYIDDLKKEIPNLIISGDYNICHQAIDIHNPKANVNSSGFLPEEREWLGKFLDNGFIDTFRHFNPDPHHYTWWSFRSGARDKNLGWRIDYHCADVSLSERLKRATILPQAKHSDHCPILLEIESVLD
jgi:exodeoxyribonuclease III